MIYNIILGIVILYLILNVVLFFMKLYECKLDKDIDKLVKDLREDAASRRYKKENNS